jgi:hypothetical protein
MGSMTEVNELTGERILLRGGQGDRLVFLQPNHYLPTSPLPQKSRNGQRSCLPFRQ